MTWQQKMVIRFYYYVFTCAYWVSIKDLKENSAPQEYAFLFVSIISALLLFAAMFIVNLIVGRNLLNGGIIIVVASAVAVFNYLLFLRKKRYVGLIEGFKEVGTSEFMRKRVSTLIIAFTVSAVLAISTAMLNNSDFKSWLFS
ncbi:MAG: hypothetical protein KF775_19750 [Cyclobacteriaceae bacterium]|nr:hypothetical protein [Cyclobacteriaceae bacterium]MBX2901890.1 hypothetical protein [Cyclobacteriaceae bacterium]